MHIKDGVASAKLFPYRLELRIARPVSLVVIRVDADAVALQRVVCILDFLQRTFDIGKRYRSEQPEALRIILHAFRTEFVDGARRSAALRGVVVNHVAHLCERQNGDSDTELVHLLDGLLHRPGAAPATALSSSTSSTAPATSTESKPGWLMVMMDIDQAAFRSGLVCLSLTEQSARRCYRARAGCRKCFDNEFAP